jgi:protein involved in polysaccharide export with SLBB domain
MRALADFESVNDESPMMFLLGLGRIVERMIFTGKHARCVSVRTIRCMFLLSTMAIVGCASSGGEPPGSKVHRVGIGDTLKIDVDGWATRIDPAGSPDLTVTVVVGPDGKITVPIAGDVIVDGKTLLEVGEAIHSSLKPQVGDASVAIYVMSPPPATTTVQPTPTCSHSLEIATNPEACPPPAGVRRL